MKSRSQQYFIKKWKEKHIVVNGEFKEAVMYFDNKLFSDILNMRMQINQNVFLGHIPAIVI